MEMKNNQPDPALKKKWDLCISELPEGFESVPCNNRMDRTSSWIVH